MFRAVNSGSFLRSPLAWFSALGMLLLAVSVALAQPRDATSQKLDVIREQMEKGQALYVGGNYAAAAQIFETGFQSYPYSAFLFNAGVCYQKMNDLERALKSFGEYLRIDPNAPDAEKVRARIAALESARAAAAAVPPPDPSADGGAPADGGPPPVAVAAAPPIDDQTAMKSLVVIETEPAGAPLRVYERIDTNARFQIGGQNPGFREVAATVAPASLTLDVGHYHVLVERFRDFNASQADINVSPGHVHHFKANLSQGEFMAFLRVVSNVRGAYLYLDDPKKRKPAWGMAPHGELVASGKHTVLIEAPGFEPQTATFELTHGEQRELELKLVRLGQGILRFDSNAQEIRILVDDQPRGVWRSGEAPFDVQLPSGRHRITVESDGRKRFESDVQVPRGQVLPLHVKMMPKYPRGAAWTEAVIGAAFIGGGVYLGLESNRIHDELAADRRAGVLEQEDSRIDKGRWFSIGANAGFAIGGVLGALATYGFIRDPLPDSSMKQGTPVEFDDPLKKRPTALKGPNGRARVATGAQHDDERGLQLQIGTGPSGIAVGGQF